MQSSQPMGGKNLYLKKGVVAFCGTRGIPANYGGFETVVEEISRHFSKEAIEVEVFCRRTSFENYPEDNNGRRLVWVQGSRVRKFDTFVSSVQTGWYLWRNRRKYAYIFWYNNANLPGILMTLLARLPMAVNTNGLEWRRAKWSPIFKVYYYAASWLISKLCRTLVSDSVGIKDFYRKNFGVTSHFIPYGVARLPAVDSDRAAAVLRDLGLEESKYFVQVTRFEPDNLPLEVAQAFLETGLADEGYQLVIVGFSGHHDYATRLKEMDGQDGLVIMNTTYDQEVLAVLRSRAAGYIHGNSVGGTNPALLEAMRACRKVMAIDIPFSREVLGETGLFFKLETLGASMRDLLDMDDRTKVMRERLKSKYRWNEVNASYMRLAQGQPAAYRPEYARESEQELIES